MSSGLLEILYEVCGIPIKRLEILQSAYFFGHFFFVSLVTLAFLLWNELLQFAFTSYFFSSDLALIHLLESRARTWNSTLDWIILAFVDFR